MVLSKVYSLQNPLYFHHGPKSSCSFCRKEGRKYVREPSYYIGPNQSFEFEGNSKHCEYHSVLNFLRTKPEIQSNVVSRT